MAGHDPGRRGTMIPCPAPICRCDLPGLTCLGPPPGQTWCLARDTEEWRRWLTGRLRPPRPGRSP